MSACPSYSRVFDPLESCNPLSFGNERQGVTMELQVTHPGFKHQRLSVRTADAATSPALLLDGTVILRIPSECTLIDDFGEVVTVQFSPELTGHLPTLKLDGEAITLARSLTWGEYVWSGLPLLLVFVGSVLGAVMGYFAALINIKIMRTGHSALMRYGLTSVTNLLSLFVLLVVALTLQPLVDLL